MNDKHKATPLPEQLLGIASTLEFQAKAALEGGRVNVLVDAIAIVPQIAKAMRDAASALSETGTSESYPGIAHHFETLRTALHHIAYGKWNDHESASSIATRALESIIGMDEEINAAAATFCPNCHCETCRPECHGLTAKQKEPV